jgi:CDP-glycerol glycerophosphotransferase (TagB/SpsB family)/ADP-heptose:LPS heptosyltransferase/predicted O-methyltransferase YrrM
MNENKTTKNKLRVALYATVPFQLRVLEPIADGFDQHLISFNVEDVKTWNPDVIVVSAEHEFPLFRSYCDKTKCELVGLRHSAGFKYTAPLKEYLMADYICGSEWDKNDFERGEIKPLKEFLLTGNAWVDKVFQVKRKKLNTINPTFLFAPTWNPDTSAAGFFHSKLVSLIRSVYPKSKILIKPHPNTLTYDHPYLIKFAIVYKKWIAGWIEEARLENVVFIEDAKISLPDFFNETDVMISDGSTAMFEFMALNRPILLYTSPSKPLVENYDADALGNKMRDIGKEFSNQKEFIESLKKLFENHTELYSKKQNDYTNEIHGNFQDGKSFQRVIDAIKMLKEKITVPVQDNLQVTKKMGDGQKLMSIDVESEFASSIKELFEKIEPKKIIETGTYLGRGTTTIIANTLRELNLFNTEFHSIEVNKVFHLQAFKNLLESGLLDFVKLHNGLSVPRELLPTLEQIKNNTVENVEFGEIYIDHEEKERALKYFEETDFSDVEDNLLEKCLKRFDYTPDFVLLDSAGHMGNIEFNYLLSKISKPCYIGLDDVYHIKHHKSLKQIQSDSRFEVIKISKEKFGFCLAKFTPIKKTNKNHDLGSIKSETNISILPKHLVAIGLIEHMGDIVACEPVSRYVRKKYPDSYIVWVVSEKYRELVDHNPYIDETYTVSCLTEWILLKQSKIFNEIIDLHIQRRVCPICEIPLPKKNGRLDITLDNYYHHGNLLSAFSQNAGLPILDDKPNVYIPSNVVQSVDDLNLPNEYIAFHCLSNEPSRDWADDKWIKLAEAITQRYNIKIVEVGHQSVLNKNKNISFINLCGGSTILQTAEVIRRAKIFIGIDSAAAHLANASQTYGIILLGEYRAFKNYIPYSGDYGKNINSELVYSAQGATSEIPVIKVLYSIEKAFNLAAKKFNKEAVPEIETVNRKNLLQKFLHQSDVRLLALYLPQFHPIPENDRWWGKGFTEWTNVSKSKPLFPGHYQPHLPSDLGFYDLRLSESRIAQAELAKKYGIEGFCYYHYWFNGKRLIERPFNEVLHSGKPDFPFCLAWANENWTKRWDGRESEMLQEQVYGGKSDVVNHFKYLLKAFLDKRYIRINNKPIFIIYRPSAIPDLQELITTWKYLAERAGLDGIYLIAMKTGFEAFPNNFWVNNGFDNELIFQPGNGKINKLNKWQKLSDLGAAEHVNTEAIVVDYEKAWNVMKEETNKDDYSFSCVVPSWDSSARRAKIGAYILQNSNPNSYQRWLEYEIEKVVHRNSDERLVVINAWNEWAEGNHLEPDQKFGHGYLKATKNAIDNSLITLAKINLIKGNISDAESLAQKALLIQIRNNAERFHSNITAFKLKQTQYDDVFDLNDKYLSEIYLTLGLIKYASQNLGDAINYFELANKYDSGNILSVLLFADILLMNGQESVVRDAYQKLFTNNDISKIVLEVAVLYSSLELNEEAESFYSIALQYNQSNSLKSNFSEYDYTILRSGKIKNIGVSANICKNVYFALQELNDAEKLLSKSLFNDAIHSFENLLRALPNNIKVLAGLAFTNSKMQKLETALRFINQAIDIEPTNINLYKIKASFYLENGETKSGLLIYSQLIKQYPKNAELLLDIAKLQKQVGNNDEAKSILKNILILEPTNTEAKTLFYSFEMVNR